MSITINYKHASLMRRLFATLLDGVLIGLFGSILLVPLDGSPYGWGYVNAPAQQAEADSIGPMISFTILFFTEISGCFPVALPLAISSLLFLLVPGATVAWVCVSILWCLLPLLISSIYHGLTESCPAKASLGKLIMGIFVSDLNGNKISFMRAMFRYLARGLSTLTCGLGFLMALGKTGQALHDKITGCIILSKK